jgi:hypothetical protein
LAALASAVVPASAQDRFALVIGNSNYKGASPLANPARDAAAISGLLKDAGFDVTSALDLDKTSMSRAIRFFTTSISEKPANSVALIYFAGHGVQVDGENYLLPVDATIAREADVALEALRLGDLMSMLETVRSKTRIVILDACRDNPFGDIAKTAPRGLALVNAPAGTLLAYSTSPGHTADDGSGSNSPFAAALLKSARQPGLPIETALKNVRLAVHGTTGGRQTPWEVSALTEPFAFFPGSAPLRTDPNAGKSAEAWRKDLQAVSARDAFAIAVRENDVVVYEQYLALFGSDPLAANLRSILDRRLLMIAWQEAVALNTAAGFAEFLARYPNTDLSATARRLQQRAQSRLAMAAATGAGRDTNLIRAISTPGPTCPCTPGSPGQPAPRTPGSPPGSNASTPLAPGGPPVIVPGGPPVIVPGGPVIVPVVPIVPPRVIIDPGRHRDPGKKDDDYQKDGKRDGGKKDSSVNTGSHGAKSGDRGTKSGDRGIKSGDRGTKSGNRNAGQGRAVEPRVGNRGAKVNRGGDAPRINAPRGNAGRIAVSRAAPRIVAPRAAPRFAAPRGGGGFGGGGNKNFRIR